MKDGSLFFVLKNKFYDILAGIGENVIEPNAGIDSRQL